MATFHVKISTDGAAFESTPLLEVSRILRKIADKADNVQDNGVALDSNGNTCAKFWVE